MAGLIHLQMICPTVQLVPAAAVLPILSVSNDTDAFALFSCIDESLDYI